jgi:hypothetical protein
MAFNIQHSTSYDRYHNFPPRLNHSFTFSHRDSDPTHRSARQLTKNILLSARSKGDREKKKVAGVPCGWADWLSRSNSGRYPSRD